MSQEDSLFNFYKTSIAKEAQKIEREIDEKAKLVLNMAKHKALLTAQIVCDDADKVFTALQKKFESRRDKINHENYLEQGRKSNKTKFHNEQNLTEHSRNQKHALYKGMQVNAATDANSFEINHDGKKITVSHDAEAKTINFQTKDHDHPAVLASFFQGVHKAASQTKNPVIKLSSGANEALKKTIINAAAEAGLYLIKGVQILLDDKVIYKMGDLLEGVVDPLIGTAVNDKGAAELLINALNTGIEKLEPIITEKANNLLSSWNAKLKQVLADDKKALSIVAPAA